MPYELERTRTFHYHVYNLDALFILAQLAEHAGVNLWDAHDRRLRTALDYIAPYVDPERGWPHPETSMNRLYLAKLLSVASEAYREPAYADLYRNHTSPPHGLTLIR